MVILSFDRESISGVGRLMFPGIAIEETSLADGRGEAGRNLDESSKEVCRVADDWGRGVSWRLAALTLALKRQLSGA